MFRTITFDKPRRVRFNHNALADIEDAAQVGIMDLLSVQKRNFSGIRLLTWAGLKYGGDRGITPERAGDLVDAYVENGKPLDALLDELLAALKDAGLFKDAKEPDDDPTVATASGSPSETT